MHCSQLESHASEETLGRTEQRVICNSSVLEMHNNSAYLQLVMQKMATALETC